MFAEYAQHGFVLAPIDPGQKRPTRKAWNRRENGITHPLAAARLQAAGLCHAYSGTAAVDIDNLPRATEWLAGHGIDLNDLLLAPDAVQIRSPSPNRAKLLYKLTVPLPTKKLAEYEVAQPGGASKRQMALELRCGTNGGRTTQDVLPPSPHPSGGAYAWAGAGDWRSLPELPEPLLRLWQSLTEAPKPADGWQHLIGLPAPPAPAAIDLEQLRALLDPLNPDMERDDWYRAGMAIHHETGGVEAGYRTWHEWSARGEKYAGPGDCRSVWDSFTIGGGITGATLRQMAASQCSASEFPTVTVQRTAPLPTAPAGPLLRPVKLDLLGADPPEVDFVIEQLVPRGFVTLLSGHGGLGKSMLSLALAAHVACGKPFGVHGSTPGRVLYLSLEDSDHVCRARLRRIVNHFKLDPVQVEENLSVLVGDESLVTEIDRGAGILGTPAFAELREAAAGCSLVIVDNASDGFDANENSRRLVRGFVRGHLQKLIAEPLNCAVMLLVHVDKAGVRHGTGGETYSGNTAWHNSARSRLALMVDEQDFRLVHEKSNHGELAQSIQLDRVEHGIVIPLTDVQVAERNEATVDAVVTAMKTAGEDVPTAISGPKTAWHVLEAHLPSTWDSHKLKQAFVMLERCGVVKRQKYRTAGRREGTRWAVCDTPMPGAAEEWRILMGL